jgi:hypothetical protein
MEKDGKEWKRKINQIEVFFHCFPMVFPWFSHGCPIIFRTQPRTAAAGRIGRGTMGDMHSSIMPCQRHKGHGVTVGPRQGHTGATNIWLCLTQIMPFTWGTDGKAGKAKKIQ